MINLPLIETKLPYSDASVAKILTDITILLGVNSFAVETFGIGSMSLMSWTPSVLSRLTHAAVDVTVISFGVTAVMNAYIELKYPSSIKMIKCIRVLKVVGTGIAIVGTAGAMTAVIFSLNGIAITAFGTQAGSKVLAAAAPTLVQWTVKTFAQSPYCQAISRYVATRFTAETFPSFCAGAALVITGLPELLKKRSTIQKAALAVLLGASGIVCAAALMGISASHITPQIVDAAARFCAQTGHCATTYARA